MCAFGRLYRLNESKFRLQLSSASYSTAISSLCDCPAHLVLAAQFVAKRPTHCSVISGAHQWSLCQSIWMRAASGAAALPTPHRSGNHTFTVRALISDRAHTATGGREFAVHCCSGSGIKVRPSQGNAAGADRLQPGEPCDSRTQFRPPRHCHHADASSSCDDGVIHQ